MQIRSDSWWNDEFLPAGRGESVDYLSRDGKTAVEVQQSTYGSRGLHSAMMQLAVYLEQNANVDRACLVLSRTRMSLPRFKEEWAASKNVLRTSVARRLGVAFVETGQTWVDPDEPLLQRIASVFESTFENGNQPAHETIRQPLGTKGYEVVKILMSRWLQKQEPIQIGELSRQAGCSYPTVRNAFDRRTLQSALKFKSNRSVELKAFPHDAWRELTALSSTLRGSLRFCDRSGEKTSLQSLLKRLEKLNPPHVAIGGVIAARYWHRDFDLHGTPRIDLEYHAPDGDIDFSFMRRLDPALVRTSDPNERAALVIHPLVRTDALFSTEVGLELPLADPIETALDLNELSLTSQANQLLTHLRPEVRLA